jgi:hypothetical protein
MRMNGMPHDYTCAHRRVDVLTLALQEEKRRQEQLELARARARQEELRLARFRNGEISLSEFPSDHSSASDSVESQMRPPLAHDGPRRRDLHAGRTECRPSQWGLWREMEQVRRVCCQAEKVRALRTHSSQASFGQGSPALLGIVQWKARGRSAYTCVSVFLCACVRVFSIYVPCSVLG